MLDDKILNKLEKLQKTQKSLNAKINKITEEISSSPSQASTSTSDESGKLEDKIKKQLLREVGTDNNVFYFCQYFRPKGTFTEQYIKEDDNMWEDGGGSGFKEINAYAPVPPALASAAYLKGSELNKGGTSHYKEQNGFSIPLFIEWIKRTNANAAKFTSSISGTQTLIKAAVAEALELERKSAEEKKRLDIQDIKSTHDTEKMNMKLKHDNLMDDKKKELEEKDGAITRCKENSIEPVLKMMFKNLESENSAIVDAYKKSIDQPPNERNLYSAIMLICSLLGEDSLFQIDIDEISSAQRELDIAQMISYYLLKAFNGKEIDHSQFSDILSDYNKIKSVKYKIELFSFKEGISGINKDQSNRIITEDKTSVGASSWNAVELKHFITLPIEHKITDFDKGSSRKAVIGKIVLN